MDIATRKKISRTMKGHSNFEGHKHTHAEKIAIAFSQEGHRNAKNHKWAINKETGKTTRVKPGANLPRGNKWGRTRSLKEWLKEEVLLEKKKVVDAISDFAEFAKQHLNLDSLPQIDINYDLEAAEKFGAFGGYYPEQQRIELNVAGRHTMDILRTLAHELVHYEQGTKEALPEDAGDTGSPYENEANAIAGVMMREYGRQNTHMFSEEVWDQKNPVKNHEKLSPANKAKAKARAKAAGRSYPNMVDNMWAAKLQEDTPSDRLEATTSLSNTYKKDTPGQKMRTLKQLKEMIGRKTKCENCDGWMVKGQKHDCTMKEAMSARLRLFRALQREQEKSAASRARAEKLLNPTPPPTPPAPKK